VYPNIVKEYYENTEMEHIYFTTPFLWDNLHNIIFEREIVTWLLAIPISNNEFKVREEKGSELFEELFEENQANVFDIRRKSIL
jgi:hypothetical protein